MLLTKLIIQGCLINFNYLKINLIQLSKNNTVHLGNCILSTFKPCITNKKC